MAEKITKQLQKLIKQQQWNTLRKHVHDIIPECVCDLLFLCNVQEQVLIFRMLTKEQAAEVFALLDAKKQDQLLHNFSQQETRQLLTSLSSEDRTTLFTELPSSVTRRLMGLLDSENLQEVQQLLGYSEESIGRLMRHDYIKVRTHWTVAEVLKHIRFYGKDSETIDFVYAIEESGYLIGSFRLRALILAELTQTVDELIDINYDKMVLSAFADREEAVMYMKKYDVVALPVVDSSHELIGIVTFDDVMDIAEEEATEDIQISASVSPLKQSYHRTGILSLYKKRITWLIILVVLNIFSTRVIGSFKEHLSTLTILVTFIPMMIGTGGNTGSQISTLIIRSLTTNELNFSKFFSSLGKEILVGLLLGITLAIIAALISIPQSQSSPYIPVVIAFSMFSIVIVANVLGFVFPFLLSFLKIDPAVASGPLISTIIDALGLLIYFSIALFIM